MRLQIIGIIFVYLFGITSWDAHAQTPRISIQLDTNRMVIGDYVTATITIDQLPNNAVVSPNRLQESFADKPIELITADTLQIGNNNVSQRIIASAYDSGQFFFPALNYQVTTGSGGSPLYLQSDSVLIQVFTVVVDTTQDIAPIEDILLVDKTFWEKALDFLAKWKWTLLGALVLIVALIVWLVRRSKKTELPLVVAPSVKLTMEERYLQLLTQIQSKGYIDNRDYKTYYSELSEALRAYIDERFDIPAPELTTHELLKAAKRVSVLKRHRPVLKEFLQTADMVKFAKAVQSEELAHRDIQIIVDFIKSTSKSKEEF